MGKTKKIKFIDYTKPLKNMRQERFCQEYMIDGNKTRSAKVAGYKCYKQQGSRMTSMVDVAGRIKFLLSVVANICNVTAEKVVSDIVNTHGRAKFDNDYSAELKASDMLMKHVGGYDKDNVVAVEGTITVKVVNFTGASKKK